MKILYDFQIFQFQKIGGISRYFIEVIKLLPKSVSKKIAIKISDNVYLNDLKPGKFKNYKYYPKDYLYNTFNFKGKYFIYKIAQRLFPSRFNDVNTINRNYSKDLIIQKKFDIFHPTYYDNYFLEFIKKKLFVITIHDMIHEIFPEYFDSKDKTVLWKKELVKRASHIIAVSENTKKDIIRFYGINENKVAVIYHASSLLNNKHCKINLPASYILFVGGRDAHKNFVFFINAIKLILNNNLSLHVFCVGKPFSEIEKQLFAELKIEKQMIQYLANDEDLFQIYSDAMCLIFPSLYEGFGIPILEAFQSGCPVLLSNRSCFPEIAKDAALYFNPESEAEIRNSITSVIENNTLRESLIKKGYDRMKDFSWEKSAYQTYEVYKKVLLEHYTERFY